MIKVIRYTIFKYVNKPKTNWNMIALEINMLGISAAEAGISLNDTLLSLQKLTNS